MKFEVSWFKGKPFAKEVIDFFEAEAKRPTGTRSIYGPVVSAAAVWIAEGLKAGQGNQGFQSINFEENTLLSGVKRGRIIMRYLEKRQISCRLTIDGADAIEKLADRVLRLELSIASAIGSLKRAPIIFANKTITRTQQYLENEVRARV